jgi:uncharacterized protein YecE (DUF72 family)
MQESLFPTDPPNDVKADVRAGQVIASTHAQSPVLPFPSAAETRDLASALPREIRLGTSSWGFPGWAGLVWADVYTTKQLARDGLPAYACHPLLRTVSLDRAFYKPLSAHEYASLAAQVPDDFRFVVKAPSAISDAMVRDHGRGLQRNATFLDPIAAAHEFVQPALDGLGPKLGALVFQLSPLPSSMLLRIPELLESLATMLAALPPLRPTAPDGVVAVEVRNAELMTAELAAVLKAAGATYCLGLHAKMPGISDQLPMLRALWPAPLVARWNLHQRHGAYGYDSAKDLYEPFDRLLDPDPETRAILSQVMAATAAAHLPVYVTINNKAEGSAPLSVEALAEAVRERHTLRTDPHPVPKR